MKTIHVLVNKRETMIFDDWDTCNDFINRFTLEFMDNIMIAAPKEAHADFIEMSAVFYNPREPKPQGQEVTLLDIAIPKP